MQRNGKNNMKTSTLGKKVNGIKGHTPTNIPDDTNRQKQNPLNDNGNPKTRVYKTLAYKLQGNFDEVADPDQRAFLAKKLAKGMKGLIYGNRIDETTGRYNYKTN